MKAAVDPAILSHSALAKAVHYVLERWPELTHFAEPVRGQLQIDSNAVESTVRVCAAGKKNYLFVDRPVAGWRSAFLYSILGTCILHASMSGII
jgi:transposase